MALGAYRGAVLGPPMHYVVTSGVTNSTFSMAALGSCISHRFSAASSYDVTSVTVQWSTVGSPGQVKITIEPIDTATGKPTGTPYDANASITVVPVVGKQTYTFAVPPSTGLTTNNLYAVVLETTVAGTTQNLVSYYTSSLGTTFPATSQTGASRAALADVIPSIPVVSVNNSAGDYYNNQLIPLGIGTSRQLYGNSCFSAQYVLPSQITCCGIRIGLNILGSPAGNLRVRFLDSNNNLVSGTDVTVPNKGLLYTGRMFEIPFAPVTLNASTYKVMLSCAGNVDASNCFYFRSLPPFFSGNHSQMMPTCFSGTSSGGDAIPGSWTNTNELLVMWLDLDNIQSGGAVATNKFFASGSF